MTPQTERLIGGRYALLDAVGRGAMGAVWHAEDRVLKRAVAIKEVDLPDSLSDDERELFEARVMREARAAARLGHPGAVTVFDVVEDDSQPWIVMEYVDAPTLDQVVGDEGPLTPARAARIGLDLLDVLEAAHAEGIVHRDVKPGNVMCLPDGHAKLGDFGIASLQDDPKITSTGLVLGSPSFMAPEQASNDDPGPPVDMWGLGATLYFAVEGEPPFDKGQAIPTLTAVMGEEPRAPRRAGELGAVIMALLDKDSRRRPEPDEIRARLQPIAAEAISTRAATVPQERSDKDTRAYSAAAPVAARTADAERAVARPATTRPAPSSSDNRWAYALVAVVVLLLALFLIPPLFDRGEETAGGRAPGQGREGAGGAKAGSDEDAAEAPAEWVTYEHPAGWSIAYPDGWEVTENPIDGDSVDFSDPASGSYLRVDWTSEPGDDVMGSLAHQEEAFASEHQDYQQVQLTETEFQGYPAGLWEYTYFDEIDLHAYNLQFVTEEHGFALNFQTHEENWESSQELWDQFQATFTAP